MRRYQPALPDDTLRRSECYPGPEVQRQIWGGKRSLTTYVRDQVKYFKNKNILILIMVTKT